MSLGKRWKNRKMGRCHLVNEGRNVQTYRCRLESVEKHRNESMSFGNWTEKPKKRNFPSDIAWLREEKLYFHSVNPWHTRKKSNSTWELKSVCEKTSFTLGHRMAADGQT
jgi:hypothetical protein